ncbi:hypothetical protein [Hydrogenophaga sp. 2FB]|uniref:hypothetical protein n=1 Tax=Hydrogenophaga sp. 2FB TaxID=2502187 RepID=UPI0010F623A0|nr:hypothetical protein [Hydrogenophaga sp. 2FB]
MSAEISTTADPSIAPKKPSAFRKFLGNLALFSILLAVFTGFKIYRDQQATLEVERAEWKQFMKDSEKGVLEKFGKWRTVTAANGEALVWEGAASEVLHVRSSSGTAENLSEVETAGTKPHWSVLAKTKNGVYYTVLFSYTVKRGFYSDEPPFPISEADVVKNLVWYGRIDLIEKYKLPMRPA